VQKGLYSIDTDGTTVCYHEQIYSSDEIASDGSASDIRTILSSTGRQTTPVPCPSTITGVAEDLDHRGVRCGAHGVGSLE
jgi:hypothetical protein